MEDFLSVNERHTSALLVDHNPDDLVEMKAELSTRGFEVLTASNGISALSRFIIYRPQLVFLEIALPGIDGFETLRRMQTNARTMKHKARFVMLTEAKTKNDIIRSVQAGAHDYIAKPVKMNSFIEKLQKQLMEIELRA